jgi:hypothetical protein
VTRCKFTCVSKTETANQWRQGNIPATVYSYRFTPVVSGSPENEKFYQFTPQGEFNLGVVTDGSFVVGKAYYFDISEAE